MKTNTNKLSPQEKLQLWLNKKIVKAKIEGCKMFMGVPDSWYESGLHCCNNGHVNSRYLKSEALGGCVCLTCMQPSHIFPSGASIDELNEALL